MASDAFDRTYVMGRLDKNRALAERSQDPSIRNIHLEYVRRYERLLTNCQDGRSQ